MCAVPFFTVVLRVRVRVLFRLEETRRTTFKPNQQDTQDITECRVCVCSHKIRQAQNTPRSVPAARLIDKLNFVELY